MSIKRSHDILQIIFTNYFWWNSMIFKHLIHFSKIHCFFSVFHIFKASYCFNLESSCGIFGVKKFEKSLKLFENKFYGNSISVFFFFINVKGIVYYFINVKFFFKLWNCAEIRSDTCSKSRNFWLRSDSKRNNCLWKSRSHRLLNFSLIV